MVTPAPVLSPPLPATSADGRAPASALCPPPSVLRPLILLGDGFSASKWDESLRAHPGAEVWTLNSSYLRGVSTLHWDIHYDDQQHRTARERARADGVPVVISPFRTAADSHEIRFPLQEIWLWFGVSLFQRTLCFQLAYACYLHDTGQQRWSVLCLPGHDFYGWPHFLLRDGPHTWLGVAKGLHIPHETSARSSLLKRCVQFWRDMKVDLHDTRVDQPHLYGHPRTITEPRATYYRWS